MDEKHELALPARRETGVFVVTLLAALYGTYQAVTGQAWWWLVLWPFVVLRAVRLAPSAAYLYLDEEAFVVRAWPFSQVYRWADTVGFAVAGGGLLGKAVTVSFDPEYVRRRAGRVPRAVVGPGSLLPAGVGATPEELAALLNDWRQATLAGSASP